MQAVILAGGKGTRLGDLVKDTPKPLIKIGDKPIIEHQILLLKKYKNVYAYNSPEYMKDMGTSERLADVKNDYESGRVNRFNKRKAIFLDRDGVINKEVNQLHRVEEFELLDSVPEAIRKMNENYLVVVITNQPVIARGLLTEEGLDEIHRKMETELGNKRAKIDKIYYCPHHPDKGFNGEIPELKIICDCRKPNIGMIKKAVEDLNIDLKRSFFIGDATRDANTAENAGIEFIGVATGYGCQDGKYKIKKGFPIYKNLLEAYDKGTH